MQGAARHLVVEELEGERVVDVAGGGVVDGEHREVRAVDAALERVRVRRGEQVPGLHLWVAAGEDVEVELVREQLRREVPDGSKDLDELRLAHGQGLARRGRPVMGEQRLLEDDLRPLVSLGRLLRGDHALLALPEEDEARDAELADPVRAVEAHDGDPKLTGVVSGALRGLRALCRRGRVIGRSLSCRLRSAGTLQCTAHINQRSNRKVNITANPLKNVQNKLVIQAVFTKHFLNSRKGCHLKFFAAADMTVNLKFSVSVSSTLLVAPLWCDLGLIPSSRSNTAAANFRPKLGPAGAAMVPPGLEMEGFLVFLPAAMISGLIKSSNFQEKNISTSTGFFGIFLPPHLRPNITGSNFKTLNFFTSLGRQ